MLETLLSLDRNGKVLNSFLSVLQGNISFSRSVFKNSTFHKTKVKTTAEDRIRNVTKSHIELSISISSISRNVSSELFSFD